MEKIITLNEVAQLWLAEKKNYVRKSTAATYGYLLDGLILPSLGQLSAVREEDVQALVNRELAHWHSQKTIKDMLVVLKMVLRYGNKHELLLSRPMDIHLPTPVEKRNIDILSIAHQRKLITYLQDNFSYRNLGIYICLTAGLRIGEVCALQWADIDLRYGVIRVSKSLQRLDGELVLTPPKTPNSVREIPMTHDLLAMARPLKRSTRPGHFVLSNSTHPIEPRRYRDYFHRLQRKLGLPHIRFHGLRHSFATRCIESKCDYKTVSVLLGHSNITTTLNLYVHPGLDQKRHCIKALERRLKAR